MANKDNPIDIFDHCASIIDIAMVQQAIRMTLDICRYQVSLAQYDPRILSPKTLSSIVELNKNCTAAAALLDDGSMDEDGIVWFTSERYSSVQQRIDKIKDIRIALINSNFSLERN